MHYHIHLRMGVLLLKKIKIVCVGKASKSFCREGCDEYLKRLKGFYDVTVVEIPEQQTIKKEADEIIKRLNGGLVVLMDIGGEMVSSERFAKILEDGHSSTDCITFVIGGASGVDNIVRERADKRVSFGRVTYPHQVLRMLLCEQLYRAATIIKRLPYHK